jgi:hypothetical protein
MNLLDAFGDIGGAAWINSKPPFPGQGLAAQLEQNALVDQAVLSVWHITSGRFLGWQKKGQPFGWPWII